MVSLPEEKEKPQKEITKQYFAENHSQISQLLTEIRTEIHHYKETQNSLAEKEACLIRLLTKLKSLLAYSKEWNMRLGRANNGYTEADDLFDFYYTCSTEIPHIIFTEHSLKEFLLELGLSLMDAEDDHVKIFFLTESDPKISATFSDFINGTIGLASQYPQDFSPTPSEKMVNSVTRAVINLEEFRNLYSANLKQEYINLIAGLTSIYQQYQTRLSLFASPSSEQQALRRLLKALISEMIQVKTTPESLYPRVKAILDAQELTLTKLIKPITSQFTNLTILQNLTHIDENVLKDSLKFKITRNILKTLKNEGANKEQRRAQGKNILIRIWERFFAPCFKSTDHTHKKVKTDIEMQTVQSQRK